MNKQSITHNILGPSGRLLSESKSDYRAKHLGEIVVFNGNVCTKDGKVWYGDINVSKDKDKLMRLAEALGEKIYVLFEEDARFGNEATPLLNKAVYECG